MDNNNQTVTKDYLKTYFQKNNVGDVLGQKIIQNLQDRGYSIIDSNTKEKKPNLLQKAGNFARDVVGSTVQNFETVGKTVEGLSSAGGIYLARKISGEDDQSFKEVYKDYLARQPKESLSGMISPNTPSEAQDITTLEGVEKTAGAFGQGLIDVATLGTGSGLVKGGFKSLAIDSAKKGGFKSLAIDSAKKGGFKSLAIDSAKIGAGVGATEAMKQGGDLQDVATGGLTGGILGVALGAGIAGVKAVTPIVRRTIQAIPEIKVKTPSISKIFEDVRDKTQAILTPNKLKEAQALGVDVKGIDKEVFNAGVRQGIEIDDVYNLTKLSKKDAEITLEVLDAAKKFTVDKTGKVPFDTIGENVVNKLKPLANIIKKVGKAVDDAAKSLKGKVNTNRQELVNTFDNILAEYDITGFPGNWNFQDSRFRLSPTLQNKLSSTLDNAYVEIKGGELADDYVLHTLKKAIDDVVDYGKRSTEGLSVNAENLLKSIRRSIDVELDKSYPSYSAINEKFSQLMDFKDDIQGLLKIDIFDIKTGKTKNAIRGAFSNRNTNTELRDFFLNLDDNLKSIGVKITEDESIARQFLFNELMEKILGKQTVTSLQAEVGKAVGAVSTARKAVSQPLSAALDLAGKGVEKLLGQSERAKIEFIEETLKNILK